MHIGLHCDLGDGTGDVGWCLKFGEHQKNKRENSLDSLKTGEQADIFELFLRAVGLVESEAEIDGWVVPRWSSTKYTFVGHVEFSPPLLGTHW